MLHSIGRLHIATLYVQASIELQAAMCAGILINALVSPSQSEIDLFQAFDEFHGLTSRSIAAMVFDQ